MAIPYNINPTTRGVNGFGLQASDLVYSVLLDANVEATITVPSSLPLGAIGMIGSINPTGDVGQDPVGHNKKNPHGYTRDHFFPRSWGNTLNGNMVLSCAKCNRKKDSNLPTREEVHLFAELWSHIKGGTSIDLTEFFYTQRLIDYLCKLVGPPLDRRNII